MQMLEKGGGYCHWNLPQGVGTLVIVAGGKIVWAMAYSVFVPKRSNQIASCK